MARPEKILSFFGKNTGKISDLEYLLKGSSINLVSAAFRSRAKSNWQDFRWLRFQVATLKSFCIGLFARALKIHPIQLIEIP